ncbi:PREDICTED: focal adhesion kinase 1-like [Nicrophorus vespilloides]|uniref:Focal adhesion kinase 1-like n=1 Tax=Nicrophorus vespilloides TaxID=110193 RepID=A0ABM1MPI5_NICVS|nr:PREDICTED: focal adhesion kinase 1-like [Nicrophorus vespilloides]
MDCLEIERDQVTLCILLGAGQYGQVYKGIYTDCFGTNRIIAVKVEKTEENKEVECNEADALRMLRHDFIINLIGVCNDRCNTSPMLMMEFAEYGELGEYLQINRPFVDTEMLLYYMWQVSSALTYIHSKDYVHRDIAVRNILVMNPRHVKLADFGLARKLENNIYIGKYYKVPIRWMSPESLKLNSFSTASDIWMFGVCVWEMLMYGAKPYNGMSNNEAFDCILRGNLLHTPEFCPEGLEELILNCWNYCPTRRPDSRKIENQLCKIINEHLSSEIDSEDEITQPKPPKMSIKDIANQVIINNRNSKFIEENIFSNYDNTVWLSSPLQNNSTNSSNNYVDQYEYMDIRSNHVLDYSSYDYDSSNYNDNLNSLLAQQLRSSEEDAEWLKQCEQSFSFV